MSKLFLTILVVIPVLPATWLPIASYRAGEPAQAMPGNYLSPPVSVNLGAIPASADIVYLMPTGIPPDGLPVVPGGGFSHIWVMDDDGSNATQITFDTSRNYEHVAVSFDRRYIVANRPDPTNVKGSVTYLFDLQNATEQIVAPDFHSLGGGGIDISVDGCIYGGCHEVQAGTDTSGFVNSLDICKIALDGSTLTKLNLINDGDVEADVAVSEDGTLVTAAIAADVVTASAHSEIRVYNADGTNLRTPHVATPPIGSYDPTLSPDNLKVAISKEDPVAPPNWPGIGGPNTAHNIYVANVDGTGSLVQLTRSGPISIIPNWQGDRIVYTEMSDADDWWGASIVNDHDPDQTPLRIKQYAVTPKWIPVAVPEPATFTLCCLGLIGIVGLSRRHRRSFQGHSIAESIQKGERTMRNLTVVGCSVLFVSISIPPASAGTLSGSIVYAALDATGRSQLFSSDLQGGQVRQLTDSDGLKSGAVRSRDGNRIAFAWRPADQWETWVMDADGTNQERLVTGVGDNIPSSWSPDGSQIVFSSNRHEGDSFQIYIMDADGSNQRQLTQSLLPDFPDATVPAWSPAQGGKIVFWSGIEHRHGEIWVMDADGGNRVQLTDEPGEVNSDNPAWSSDGRYIIFETSRSGVRVETWVMDADGSNERLLFPYGGFGGRLNWHVPEPATAVLCSLGLFGMVGLSWRHRALRQKFEFTR